MSAAMALHRKVCSLLLLALVAASCSDSDDDRARGLLVGAARRDITPDSTTAPPDGSVYLGGYGIGPVRLSTGVLAPIYVRAFVVTGEGSLDGQSLQGKVVGELATRCRQSGVACHAIVGRSRLDPFEERILDLASVTEATTLAELEAAGRAL